MPFCGFPPSRPLLSHLLVLLIKVIDHVANPVTLARAPNTRKEHISASKHEVPAGGGGRWRVEEGEGG